MTLENGTEQDLDRLCADLASAPFDHSLPLWATLIVDGLTENRVALIYRIHEALTTAEFGDFDALDDKSLPHQPTPTEVLEHQRRAKIRGAQHALKGLPSATFQAARVSARAVRSGNRWATGPCTGQSAIATFTIPVDSVKFLRSQNDASFNEVLLGVIAEGLSAGLKAAGVPARSIGLMSVVSRDDENGRTLSAWFLRLRTEHRSLGARLREVRAENQYWRRHALADGSELMTSLGMWAWRWARPPRRPSLMFHVAVSNVGAFDMMFEVPTARMLSAHFIGATTQQSPVNIGVLSAQGTVFIGIHIDVGAVPFAEKLISGLGDALGRASNPVDESVESSL